ncbi:DUF99 family protein [Geitlerinema sp. CS-897]|uniref:endonuclease dU n=1 Tax=Baaleninema simplex TaxID=2862350 RepID=UPI0003491EB4|nr:DUF99 family protein [Baaleninema simplex]MDC0835042.1 DUF99 family protein [Geitlerinema sp. CS-897]
MKLSDLVRLKRTVRVIGFDDAPFERNSDRAVAIAGVVCGGTRFEGMVWGQIEPDGWDATDRICDLLLEGKFLPQLHLVLLDGIGFGGFNLIDLPLLAQRLQRPCVALMRRPPKLKKMEQAMRRLPDFEKRWDRIRRAGRIYASPPFYFQVCGESPGTIAKVLRSLTECGHVPEALRLAHLIGSAVMKGESGTRA